MGNGSLVDIVDEQDEEQPSTADPSIKKLDVSNLTSSNNEEEQLETCSVSVRYVTESNDSQNVNNGSLINADSLQNTLIVSNNIDELNQSDIEEADQMEEIEAENASSLSLEATPKLNESMEKFIRNSLNPESAQKSILQIEFEENKKERDDEEDDVDMETTPISELHRMASLHDEIINPIDDDTEVTNVNMMNNSMLSMNASRISVHNDNDDESMSPEKSSSATPNWKNTPLKALQILESYTERLSTEPSTKSVSNEADIENDQEMQSSKKEITESAESNEAEIEKDEEVQTTDNNNSKKEMTESPKACFVENLFFKTPVKVPENYVVPKTEVEEEESSKNISITFSDGQKFAFKSVYSASKSVQKSESVSAAATNLKMEKKKLVFRKRSQSMISKSMTPEILCEKTTAIKRMMQEVEMNYHKETQSQTEPKIKKVKKSPIRKAKAAPDWNAIHNKQIFSRQPNLAEWDKSNKERTQRLFGSSNAKMSA